NADGLLDAAVAHGQRVSVWAGNGDGTFRTPVTSAAGPSVWSLVAGDFDLDGLLDVAVANFTAEGTVSVLLGQGDGSFQPPRSSPVGPSPYDLTAADFNADGVLDVAAVIRFEPAVSAALGVGDGTFAAPASHAVGNLPYLVTSADFNADGLPDLAVANYGSRSVAVLFNDGDWAPVAAPRRAAERTAGSRPPRRRSTGPRLRAALRRPLPPHPRRTGQRRRRSWTGSWRSARWTTVSPPRLPGP